MKVNYLKISYRSKRTTVIDENGMLVTSLWCSDFIVLYVGDRVIVLVTFLVMLVTFKVFLVTFLLMLMAF